MFICAQNTYFLGTFVDCSWSGQNFLLNYVYYGRSWKDEYGNIYICNEKPSTTFKIWILVFNWAQNSYFLGIFVDCLWPAQNFLLDNAYYGRSWKDNYGNIYICKEKSSRTFEFWNLVFICALKYLLFGYFRGFFMLRTEFSFKLCILW